MPRPKRGRLDANIELHASDAIEDLSFVRTPNANESGEAKEEHVSCVKMKLHSFCKDAGLVREIDRLVLDANLVIGEAYALANLHVLRTMASNPTCLSLDIDDRFWYRCLRCVTDAGCPRTELSPGFLASVAEFDGFRPPESKTKTRMTPALASVIEDLRIVMSTAATNHLWLNIGKRLHRYAKERCNGNKRLATRVVTGVLRTPKVAPADVVRERNVDDWGLLDKDGRARMAKKQKVSVLRAAVQHVCPSNDAWRSHAKPYLATLLAGLDECPFEVDDVVELNAVDAACAALIEELRALLPLEYGVKSDQVPNAKPGLTLPLYFKILESLNTQDPAHLKRTFSLLPTKGGFTMSFIPVSDKTLAACVRAQNLESCTVLSDNWSKYFTLRLVNTVNRKFDERVSTDGVSVSIQMKASTSVIAPRSEPYSPEYLTALLDAGARVSGSDPGFTDVVNTFNKCGNVVTDMSFSAARYYHEAGFNASKLVTEKLLKGTETDTQDFPSPKTADLEAMRLHVSVYLAVHVKLHRHRHEKKFRDMRFMRFRGKQKTIVAIARAIAPEDGVLNIVGFGNWGGGHGSCVSRRAAGPLQELKLLLKNRRDVIFIDIDEFRTSITCNCCKSSMRNMRAISYNRRTLAATPNRVKVHSVFHCYSRTCAKRKGTANGCDVKDDIGRARRTTWNRDANAARNIFDLTMCLIKGVPRPPALTRQAKKIHKLP